jgi:subtilisin family serine protease
MWLMLMSVAAPAGHAWFYPGSGDEVAVIDERSAIAGVPVRRTGYLVARVEDPAVLRSLADVAEVESLGGDGHVVRVLPRAGVDEIALSRTLRQRADVAWSHPDLALRLVPQDLPDDPFVGDQWHLENTGQNGWTPGVDINAALAWTRSTGAGGIIAVFDSGVDSDHPDLDVIPGWDYVDSDDDPNPDVSTSEAPHGTCVAGLAAARGNNGLGVAGVAYDSKVYAVRLLGASSTLSSLYSAFAEAVDAGAWVLNNSWGFGTSDCPDVPEYSIFRDAMDYAEMHGRGGLGTAVVFAAGNGNCDISNDGLLAQPEVIAVAATNGNDDREGYSSFGAYVDVAAPSGGTLTTDIVGDDGYGSWKGDPDYYGYFSGTSAAAPVASGVLALMFAANARLTAAQARRVLCETAVKVDVENGEYDDKGWSKYYGCGRVDAGAAVMAVADQAPAAPVIVAPGSQAWVERVVLGWKPAADADGDWLAYEVTWWVDGQQANAVVESTAKTHLDITGEVASGDVVHFTVQAMDAWGKGELSEARSFEIVEHPADEITPSQETGGCTCSDGFRGKPTAPILLLGGCAILLRRRRRRFRASGLRGGVR